MGYYQGDFYAGARGDPFWGALLKAGISGISGLLGRGRKAIAPILQSGTIATAAGAGTAIMRRGGQMIMKHPVLSAAGAAGALGTVGMVSRMGGAGAPPRMMGAGGDFAPKGYHMSKPRGGACPSEPHLVRNRRMNVANGRALSRAVRRLHHFARKYRKVVGFVSPRKPKGRMYFRKRKKTA